MRVRVRKIKVDEASQRLESAYNRSKAVFLEEAQSILMSTLTQTASTSRGIILQSSMFIIIMLHIFTGTSKSESSLRFRNQVIPCKESEDG